MKITADEWKDIFIIIFLKMAQKMKISLDISRHWNEIFMECDVWK